MSSALLPRCPTRVPHPSLAAAAAGGSSPILSMLLRPLRCGGVFCCSNPASSPRLAVDRPRFSVDFYEVLGIRQDGSYDEIKQAYKRMALKYHPDVSPPDCTDEYTQHFIVLKKAYETLSNPVTRAFYDRHLAGGLHSNEKMEELSRWRANWEDQLEGLERRSMRKHSENLPGETQMRRKGMDHQVYNFIPPVLSE